MVNLVGLSEDLQDGRIAVGQQFGVEEEALARHGLVHLRDGRRRRRRERRHLLVLDRRRRRFGLGRGVLVLDDRRRRRRRRFDLLDLVVVLGAFDLFWSGLGLGLDQVGRSFLDLEFRFRASIYWFKFSGY